MRAICPCSDCRNGRNEKRTGNVSEKQVEILEAAYSQWPQPFPDLLSHLVVETAMKPEELKEWFREKNKTKVAECFNIQVKNMHADQHGRQTKKEDMYVLANSKSVESSMELTKINVNRADAKKKNENYSNVDVKAIKKRPISKVSEVALKKTRVNVGLLKPRSNEKKNENDSVVYTKDSQNIKLSTENDEIGTKCEFCPEYFLSRTDLFVHMMIHVPPRIKENLAKVEGEPAWCVHCPGPVPVDQVNSHMAKCHMEVDVGDIDPKDMIEEGFELKIEDGFELGEVKCEERNLVGPGIPNLMVECAPVLVKFIPEEFCKCIVNLEDFKL